MEHRPADSIEWTPAPAEHFTGDVSFGPLSQVDGALNALGVHFEPGARTNWHRHPDGQVLYVVDGTGRVGNADGEMVEIAPGDVVYTPPGEVHWHGASPEESMTHLSLTTGGPTEWIDRSVTDDEYDV